MSVEDTHRRRSKARPIPFDRIGLLAMVLVPVAVALLKPAPPPAGPAAIYLTAPGAEAMAVAATGTPTTGAPLTVTATNIGTGPSAPLAVQVDGPVFALARDGCSGRVLAAGASCTLAVTATVAADGPFSGGLSVNGTVLLLAGEATGFAPTLTLPGPDPLVLPPIDMETAIAACVDVAVANSGLVPLTGLTASLDGAHAAQFLPCEPTGTACIDTLAPGARCQLGYRLTVAATMEELTAVLHVSAAELNGPVTRFLSGHVFGEIAMMEVDVPHILAPITDGAAKGPCTALTVMNIGRAPGVAGAAIVAAPWTRVETCTPTAGTPCSDAPLPVGGECVLGLRLHGTKDFELDSSGVEIQADGGDQGIASTITGSASGYVVPLAVLSASYGDGCTGCADDNLLPALQALCDGHSACSFMATDMVEDCAPGCIKPVRYSYRCADGPVQHYASPDGAEVGAWPLPLQCK